MVPYDTSKTPQLVKVLRTATMDRVWTLERDKDLELNILSILLLLLIPLLEAEKSLGGISTKLGCCKSKTWLTMEEPPFLLMIILFPHA